MIVVEDKLAALFSQIPEIKINDNITKKLTFSWGNELEINRYIEKSKSQCYPLVWLLPTEETYSNSKDLTEKKVSLVIAQLEDRKELYNGQRWKGSYEHVLNPLTNYIIQAFSKSATTRITDSDISIFKHPNYSKKNENVTIDRWDATRIDISIEFNNKFCINEIKWQNPLNENT
jgi:hypothetical protein